MNKDTQIIALQGRNLLVNQMLSAGLEVALPLRDRGVDLIAFLDADEECDRCAACPIQVKAASKATFSVDKKYERFRDLLLCYVWNVASPADVRIFALFYPEAVAIADKLGYTKNCSWVVKGGWSVSNPGKELRDLLAPYEMQPPLWRDKILSTTPWRK